MVGIDAFRNITNPEALRRDGLFVAEGRFVVRSLLSSPRFKARAVLVTPVAFDALHDVLPPSLPCYVVDQPTMDSTVGFNIHRGCVALAERPDLPSIEQVDLTTLRRVIVLEAVSNPDNIGGIFRSAAAFGAELVVLAPGCGDPFYRKAMRTSMAATLDVPIAIAGEWPDALNTLRARGLQVVAFTPAAAATPLQEHCRSERTALLFGTEGAGLSAPALARADQRIRIRTTDRVDSLNVTVAASIAMHHCFT